MLQLNAQSKREQILEASKTVVTTQYNTIYNSFNTLAQIVFKGYINKKEIVEAFAFKNREKLYELLKEDYAYLNSIDFEQIHFHTQKNHSFLRMHEPKRFGDDLSSVRYSVKYVNELKEPIAGLEMGRIVPGFRFVYPMFDDTKSHIGSVETSFSVKAFSKKIENVYDVHTHFLLHKSIFNEKIFATHKQNYSKSIESDDYILLNRNTTLTTNNEEVLLKNIFSQHLKKKLKIKLKEYKSFSMEIEILNKEVHKHKIVTFLPLQNIEKENIGYYVVYQNSNALFKLEKEFLTSLAILTLLNLLIVFLIYKSVMNKEMLKQLVKDKTKKLNTSNKKLKELNNSLETRIKKEVEKVKIQEHKLFEAEKMAQMGDMISNIAHQWRQPLNTISICASGVKLSYEMQLNSEEESCMYMDMILKNTQDMSRTIDVFRNFINQKEEYKEVAAQKILEDVITIMGESLKYNNIEIQNQIESCEPLILKTIPKDLTQVIVNMLTNAKDILKQRETKNPKVIIGLQKEKEHICISIEDNAGGIANEHISKIFDPYYTTKHKSVGTGLGLYISQKIVHESLKGKLLVENTSFGAKFTIELPFGF
ncbi:MAG: cache domain-containing protein [Arcobacteraceae bacterium]